MIRDQGIGEGWRHALTNDMPAPRLDVTYLPHETGQSGRPGDSDARECGCRPRRHPTKSRFPFGIRRQVRHVDPSVSPISSGLLAHRAWRGVFYGVHSHEGMSACIQHHCWSCSSACLSSTMVLCSESAYGTAITHIRRLSTVPPRKINEDHRAQLTGIPLRVINSPASNPSP